MEVRRMRTVSFSSDPAYDSVVHYLVKTRLSDSEAEEPPCTFPRFVYNWFSFHLIVSDGVVVRGIRTLFSLDRYVKFYASDYDSDSFASENQP